MRPIKFRYLWKGKWYYIDFEKDNLAIKWELYESRAKTTFPEQFTGLLDKNKKEIYEGDIVKFENQIFKVEYWLAEFIIRQISGRMKGVGDSITASKLEYEVIGNIYDDKGLLK